MNKPYKKNKQEEALTKREFFILLKKIKIIDFNIKKILYLQYERSLEEKNNNIPIIDEFNM